MVRVIMDEIYGCRPIETMMSDPEGSDILVFFSSRRRHTRYWRDWSSDVCSSDLTVTQILVKPGDQVQANQPLARLDVTAAQLRVEQAQADLQQAQADFDHLKDKATDRKSVV